MLHRYNDLDFIMNMGFQEGFKLIIKVFQEKEKKKMWELYVSIYPQMNKENYVSFKEFCGEVSKIDNNIDEEKILNDVRSILK